eukprot:5966935-Amphidinium_carterae.1
MSCAVESEDELGRACCSHVRAKVAAALTSDTAVAVIEEALVAELQAIDPSLTVTSLQVRH